MPIPHSRLPTSRLRDVALMLNFADVINDVGKK